MLGMDGRGVWSALGSLPQAHPGPLHLNWNGHPSQASFRDPEPLSSIMKAPLL